MYCDRYNYNNFQYFTNIKHPVTLLRISWVLLSNFKIYICCSYDLQEFVSVFKKITQNLKSSFIHQKGYLLILLVILPLFRLATVAI